MSKKKTQETDASADNPELAQDEKQEHLGLSTMEGEVINLTEEIAKEKNRMKKEEKKIKCECGTEMETYARGKDMRIYRCPHCSTASEPKLFWRETLKINAMRPLTPGRLIDLNARQKNLLE